VLLWDFRLSDSDGVEMLERVKAAAMRVPIIVLADSDDAAQALQALRIGAQDCIVRSELETASLVRSLRHAIERHRLLQQLREAGEQARHLASHDSLTGLANRSAFQSLLDHGLALAQRHDSRLALLFLDIDRFKHINDTLGHSVGDDLICQVAARLATRGADPTYSRVWVATSSW
jgi:PleD family two-component response regulator